VLGENLRSEIRPLIWVSSCDEIVGERVEICW